MYGKWHYINYDGTDEELYDLEADPEEWTNLASDPPDRSVIEMLKAFIPTERAEDVRTGPIRWADVLSGKTKF